MKQYIEFVGAYIITVGSFFVTYVVYTYMKEHSKRKQKKHIKQNLDTE